MTNHEVLKILTASQLADWLMRMKCCVCDEMSTCDDLQKHGCYTELLKWLNKEEVAEEPCVNCIHRQGFYCGRQEYPFNIEAGEKGCYHKQTARKPFDDMPFDFCYRCNIVSNYCFLIDGECINKKANGLIDRTSGKNDES